MKKKVPKFYLAHSFICLKKVRRWQLIMEGKYNIKFVNPFFANEYEKVEDLKVIKTKKALNTYLNSFNLNKCYNIMDTDIELIRKSDGLVSYFESPTIGTCQEIFAAAYFFRIPVYIITNKYGNHPWLRALADMNDGGIFRNRTEFKKYAKKKWGEKQ
jgi:hypothetical protein